MRAASTGRLINLFQIRGRQISVDQQEISVIRLERRFLRSWLKSPI